jgi:hypothetical protein
MAGCREKRAIVLAHRGECTFSTKARMAHAVGASAVIFVNDREGLEHAAGPDAHDLDFCSVMVTQVEGQLLGEKLLERAALGVEPPLAR